MVVDLQERLIPALSGGPELLGRAGALIWAARLFEVPVTLTEEYPEGLGSTVPQIASALPDDAAVIAKLAFGATREDAFSARIDALKASGRDQFVLAGAETHVCLLQTALGLRERGETVYLVADACASRRAADREGAIERMKTCGVACVTTEMVLFEWLERKDSPAFAEILELVR
ncbi:MAG: hydrolase [Proteobacteria bacterium]|nr:hydrolase [Pseudomonadota bacterium]